jgi:hypothetical protein
MLSLAVLTAVSLPVASNAADSDAVDQCVQTFVKEMLPAGHSVEIRSEAIRSSATLLGSGRSIVNVVARGEKHGKLFGSAKCVISRQGSLVSMQLRGTRIRVADQGAPIQAG